ncbi:MAG TPA: hypothetical protein PLU83_08265, partial [Phycicoccus sp.]|nr:hypothetical protein [Phycicoccus sp.]
THRAGQVGDGRDLGQQAAGGLGGVSHDAPILGMPGQSSGRFLPDTLGWARQSCVCRPLSRRGQGPARALKR